MLSGAFIVSQVKIVPQVEEMLLGVNAKPDGMTAISFKVSHFTQATWPIFVIGVISLAVIIARSGHVRNLILGFFMSKWRLLRLLIMSLRQMTFISTIKLLHSNGINLAKSIRVSANSVRNTPFYNELRTAADKYENSGVPLSTAFAKYTSVDAQVTHMLAIGEKSASLDAQLEMLSEMYEEDLQNHMNAFAAAISFVVLIIAVALDRRCLRRNLPPDLPDGTEDDAKRNLIRTQPQHPNTMQLTRFDRWLREKFVYETHIQTLRSPDSIPAGMRAEELPDAPGRRYKHLFVATR